MRSVPERIMRRREFLRTATGITTVAYARRVTAAPPRMFVSLNISLIGTKTGSDGRSASAVEWPDFARLAARVGYAGAALNLNAAMEEGAETTAASFFR